MHVEEGGSRGAFSSDTRRAIPSVSYTHLFEGLYAEVVNAGLLEVLQRDYQVNVAGPSTMAALLLSLIHI